jgi:hypothetical protein
MQDTKLDVLNILANVAAGSKTAVGEVRSALQGVSEWFDEYMSTEETTAGQVHSTVLFNYLIDVSTFPTLGTRVEQSDGSVAGTVLGIQVED